MSAVVPGTGQLASGAPRGLAYLVAEAGLLAGHFLSIGAGRAARDRYRTIAFEVARKPFQPLSVDTAFSYYEAMGKYIRSGPFDTDPGPEFVPPSDPNTYNGRMWDLARRTFFADPSSPPPTDSPEYANALAFYRRRAVGPGFEWSWSGAAEAMEIYREELEHSDDVFQRATVLAGVVVANHLVSAIDAIISARVRSRDVGLQSEVGVDPRRGRVGSWRLGIRLAF